MKRNDLYRDTVAEIRRIKDEIDLLKGLPSEAIGMHEKIAADLNKHLEKELIQWSKLLTEIKIDS